ncbi:MAG: hypothetical protein KDA73_04565 [Rhodobacteraceae bacterium]|nr:hypothetical protein [Paracoccaceae bacterium]
MPPKTEFDPARFAFKLTLGVIGLTSAFAIGLYSGYKQNGLFQAADFAKRSLITTFREAPDLVQSGPPVHFLQPSRKPGEGVTVNARPDDGRLILMTGFFDGGNALRLIRRDGTIVAEWPVSYTTLFPDPDYLNHPPTTDWNVDLHGAVIDPDGSVVFNFEYSGAVKLSRCGDVLWKLREPTHHSVERAESGGYWIAGQNFFVDDPERRFDPITRLSDGEPYGEALALHVSEDGQVLQRISIPEMLFKNGLKPLLTAGGFSFVHGAHWEHELVHLNKIAELPTSYAAAFPEFEPGDLLLSMRMQNLLLVFDPDTQRVKWHQTGPWQRQHDPEFNADGTITVFNNNTYKVDMLPGGRSDPALPRVSNITRVDPRTGQTEVAYGQKPGQEMLSIIRGKQESMPGGGFLITEFEAGRAFEVDADGRLVWEYLNRYDADRVLEITEARSYPADYFSVTDWSCAEETASR